MVFSCSFLVSVLFVGFLSKLHGFLASNLKLFCRKGLLKNDNSQIFQRLYYLISILAGEFVESQSLKTIQGSDVAFERKYKFDPTNERYIRRLFTDEILREMVGSSEVVAAIESEWEQLQRDRESLRQIFPNGNYFH